MSWMYEKDRNRSMQKVIEMPRKMKQQNNFK